MKQYGEDKREVGADKRKPSSEVVEDFHTNADTDSRNEALHHTLGPNAGQASPGPHNHQGGDSVALFDGQVITGSRGGNVALVSVISLLVRLGATDNTTP